MNDEATAVEPEIQRRVTSQAQEHERDSHGQGLTRSNGLRLIGFAVLAVVLLAAILASIGIGAKAISPATIWQTFTAYDPTLEDHVAIVDLRLPRTLAGLIVGPALGLCGALIQSFTRNPLADPGILGVNAGATFAVTIAVGVFGIAQPSGYIWFALGGAAVVTILVYSLGSIGGSRGSAGKLVLAGVAISAALGGLTTALTLSNRDAFDDMRFWGVGSIGGRQLDYVLGFTPFIVIGLILGLATAKALNSLAFGDELATSLGVRIGRTRVVVIIAVTLLAGTATALAGPIAFVGLMVPHTVRWFVGPDQRWIFAYSLLAAPLLLLISDIIGRVILPTGELRVGLVTAIVGAPVLILLARRKSVSGL